MLQDVITDELTGARTRTNVKGVLNDCKEQVDLRQSQLILAVIDIDHFKKINDTYGHSAGDSVLIETAQRILRTFPNGSLVRMGGDEFLLLLELKKAEELENIKTRLEKIFPEDLHIDTLSIPVSLSVGIGVYPKHGNRMENLVQSADYAMYHAKKNSLGVSIFNEAMQKEIGRTKLIISLMQEAISKGEIHLVYQPILDLKTGQLTGLEALARWNCEILGNINPGEFIRVAEASGQIRALGWSILDSALNQVAEWTESFRNFGVVTSINVSVLQFLEEQFAEKFLEKVKGRSIPPGLLAIEVTETTEIRRLDILRSELRKIREAGIKIYLDDFGTGFSSLSLLRELPVDKIKIDRSFVSDLHARGNNSRIIQSITLMARSLGIGVVAEGIETQWQKSFLSSFLCNEGQGYLFSHGLSPHELGLSDWFSGNPNLS